MNETKKGDKFRYLTIVKELPQPKYGVRFFLCKCICGNYHKARLVYLTTGKTKSCGCYRKKVAGEKAKKHGMAGTRLWRIWCAMRQRCMNPKSRGYSYYGVRGISVCKQWLNFSHFANWAMNNGYREELTIERIDNDGNYEPSNCKWISQAEQTKNSRHCHYITHNGKTATVTDWSKMVGINRSALDSRIRRGWSIEAALTK